MAPKIDLDSPGGEISTRHLTQYPGGVTKLVEEKRYCLEILTRMAAIQEALRGVSRDIIRNHLETRLTDAIKIGKRDTHYRELTNITFKLNR